ncbi:MAG TPA: L-idonate 5-dehydrogenase [Motilibacteraceae bacterium]|nr:L-idonate 5-dehydrogenase [Motilibacteraceae bacterium]
MLACVVHGVHDLRVEELPDPEPGPGETLVRIAYGGICGSDLHYYHRGGVGDFRLREPMVLGHEVVGTVAGHGAGGGDSVTGLPEGTPVAVHPARPCGRCRECTSGRRNVCRDAGYLGSAARFPHVQGGFAQLLAVPSDRVVPLPAGLGLERAALAEPTAVALHAVRRAGDVAGREVLVTGAGPIGCLVVVALRAAGAGRIVVSDLVDEALAVASAVGADAVVRADRPEDPAWPTEADVVVEASGSPAGLASALAHVRRGGRVVALGLLPPGDSPVAGNLLVTREIELVGAFRFDAELADAVALLASADDVAAPVVTAVRPVKDAVEAIELAGDRRRACKVLLDLS